MKLKFILIIYSAILVAGCSNADNGAIPAVSVEQLPDQVCYNLDIAFIDSSTTKAVVVAGRAQIYNDSSKTYLDRGVNVEFYDAFGKRTGTLTADNVVINDITKDMIATGNVVVVGDSTRTTLHTSELEWNNTTKLIHNKSYVKIVSPTEIIEGIGIETNENLSNYKIYKVTGIKDYM
ncbi:MAG: LPS export ABC transporter periplasmic protein LptC [Ignavibacteria bacterium]|jgi:LPS export ABC transporter protein LptC|nr:LPS export ABC transporter periplasmic protein LptC [Ignavibacteria bacterium]